MINLELLNESESISLKLKENTGTGTSDYNDLTNKPSINGVELQGALTTEDLGIESESLDVQVNGVSIVNDGVANIPIADYSKIGLVKPYMAGGVFANAKGELYLPVASNTEVDSWAKNPRVITASNLDYAVKQAMTDGKGAQWTSQEKASARARMGVGVWEEVPILLLKKMSNISTSNSTKRIERFMSMYHKMVVK